MAHPAQPPDPKEPRRRRGLPERFRLNVISGYLRTAIAAVLALVTVPVLVTGLGKSAYGVWVIVDSFAAYREILQLGFAKAAPKYVAEYGALGDHVRARAAVATSFWILMVPGAVAMLLGLGLAAIFPSLFGLEGSLAQSAQAVVLIVVANVAVSIPSDAFGGALIGLQRFDLLNWTLIVVLVVQAAGSIIVMLAGGGLVLLGIVVVVPSLLGQFWRFLITRRLMPGISVLPRYVDRDLVRPFVGLSVWLGIVDISSLVLTKLDTIVVGVVLGVEAAAVYAVGAKLPILIGQLVAQASRVFFPHASDLAARRDARGLQDALVTGTRLLLAIGVPLAIVLSVLADPILQIWVGEGFADGATVAVLLSAGMVISALNQTGLQMLQGMGKARIPALVYASEAVLNLVLSVVLANLIGISGVALGTLLAGLIVSVIAFFPYMCRQFDLPLWSFVGSLLAAHAPPAAAALATGWLVTRADVSGVLGIAAGAAAMFAVYIPIYALTALDGHERREIALRLRRRGRAEPVTS
jgi:O-antigen/teichoic acid export membrane protein